MEFTSETGLVEVAVSLLAAASALIGVASSLSQLSRSAKARRTIEWIDKLTNEEAEDCNSANWKAIKTSEEAYLIASYHVGRWQSAMTLAWIAASPLFILAIVYYKNIFILAYCVIGMFALSRQEIKAIFRRSGIVEQYIANKDFSVDEGENKCHPVWFALARSLGAFLLYGGLSLAMLTESVCWSIGSLMSALIAGCILFSSMLPPTKAWWMKKFTKTPKK